MHTRRDWLCGLLSALLLVGVATLAGAADGDDAVMYGGGVSRNMALDATGLPVEFDVKTGKNVKWSMPLGSQAYAGPVVYDGMVFVGTNNEHLYNPKLKGDRGNVMAFAVEDGEFLWQSAHPKLPAGRVNDWPLQGVCSTPALADGRIYYVSNRAEVVCADADGFRDGTNDGPFVEESETSEIDEDVIWTFDLINELDAFPHNLAAGSPLLVDGVLYAVTGQGVDEGHVNVPSPLGPSLVALRMSDGELLWENNDPGDKILHGSWSNPTYAELGGVKQVMYPGGDGWLRSFNPKTGELLWKFDLNPKDSVWELGGAGTRNNVISTPVIYDDKIYLGVGQDPEHGEGEGNFYAIDAVGKTGDITATATVWHVGGDDFHRTMSSAAIQDDLLYIADLSGFLYCFDAQTGKLYWKYDTFAAIWGSPMIADGKVYLGDEDGDLAVLKHGKQMELLGESNLGAAAYTTPLAKDGVLYVVTRNRLFALEEGATFTPKPKPEPKPEPKAEPEAEPKTDSEAG